MLFSLIKPVYAQCMPGTTQLLDLTDCVRTNGGRVNYLYDTPATIVTVIINNLFILAGILLFFIILYSGFLMTTKGKQGFEDARKILTGSVIGFLLMFCAYWIVQIINVLTGADLYF